MGRMPYCEKQSRRIEEDSENPVNPALIGFPEWCPLKTVNTAGEPKTNYKKEIKQIMRIMEDDSSPDAVTEAAHYLNSVVEDAKKKAETD
jgi:hypothetical protein